jgi:hypothetical protein
MNKLVLESLRHFISLKPYASFLLKTVPLSIALMSMPTAHGKGMLKSNSRIKETPTVAVPAKDPARSFYEKTYNAENKGQQFKNKPADAPSLIDDSRRHVGNTMSRITNHNSDARNHRALQAMYDRAPVPTKQSQQMRAAAGKIEERYSNPTTSAEVSTHLTDHLKKEANDIVVALLPYWQQLTGGLNFSFGMGETKSDPEQEARTANQSIKYGLVLKDVKASEKLAMHAALASDDMHEWENAPDARLEWTIGPVSPNSDISLRKFEPESTSDKSDEMVSLMKVYQRSNQDLAQSVVAFVRENQGKIPKLQFKGNAKFRAAPTAGSTSLPGLEVNLNQIENYYTMTYLTTPTLAKDGISHTIRLPLFGTLALQRKFDEKGKPTETHVTGILVKNDLPAVSVGCNHAAGNFKTEVIHSGSKGNIKVVSEAPKGCPVTDRKLRHEGEKYSLEYTVNF